MHKILPVIAIFGKVLMTFSLCYFAPIIVSHLYQEHSGKYFFKSLLKIN